MDDMPDFSRSGFSNPLGKLTPMPKVNLCEDTLDGIRARATRAGMPFSEYVRLVLEAHVHGPDHAAKVAALRIGAVLGTGAGMGPQS